MEKHLENQTAFCKKHPTSKVGRDQFGQFYAKCWTGHKFNEPCEIVVEEKTIASSRRQIK